MKKIVIILLPAIFFIFFCSQKHNPGFPTAADNSPAYTELVSVPGGIFTQTDGVNSFNSTVSPFKMGKYLVTYDLWYTVYRWAVANGYSFQNAGAEGLAGVIGAAPTAAKYQPVSGVSWRDVIIWCNACSQKSGFKQVYYSDAGFTVPIRDSTSGIYALSINSTAGSFDNPYVDWNADGYRLPTESEYYCAASYVDGTNWTPYNYASGASADYTNAAATGLVAWYSANSTSTNIVGGKAPNALGIYDMSGNVWEWCWDWYGAYPTVASSNYKGPATGVNRDIRGGCYNNPADNVALGSRGFWGPYTNSGSFRLVRGN
jgi:formylglycine-generating enzyme required for sulfatase activity